MTEQAPNPHDDGAARALKVTTLQVVGALDWRLDGHLSGFGALPGAADERGMWTLRLRQGRAQCFWRDAVRSPLPLPGAVPLVASDGRPWLSSELAGSLARRWSLPTPLGAVLCARADGTFMAVPNEQRTSVALHRFATGAQAAHAGWSLVRPSPGPLLQLFVFGEHAALVDLPAEGSSGARLLLYQYGTSSQPICVLLHHKLCHPGIVNAYMSGEHCTLDIVLGDASEKPKHGRLWRYSIARSGLLSRRLLSTSAITDAVVHPGQRGRAQRFAYLSCMDVRTASSCLCRLDLNGLDSECCRVPFGQHTRGVAVVASRGDGDDAVEPAAWLATILHDRANDTSRILLAPARTLARERSVSIRMPSGMTLERALLWTARPPLVATSTLEREA